MKTIITAAVASLIAIVPAAAAPKAPPAPAPAASQDLDRPAATRYCYRTEITGSRIVKRLCHTRADWKDLGVTVPKGL